MVSAQFAWGAESELAHGSDSQPEWGAESEPGSGFASKSASGFAPDPAPAGVGMLLTLDKPGHFVVQYVLPDMPAAKVAVKVGDVVLAVDGVPVDNVKTVEELVDKIRGAVGSSVKLKLQSGDKMRDITLVRGMIPTVKSKATDDFRSQVSIYFYPQDLIPGPDMSAVAYKYGFASDQTVRDFLRKHLSTGHIDF